MCERTDPVVEHMSDEAVASYIVFPSLEFSAEDYRLAEEEAQQLATSKPNPRKTA
ncbi:hypothetical protein D3C76_1825700 [compost metagenome]